MSYCIHYGDQMTIEKRCSQRIRRKKKFIIIIVCALAILSGICFRDVIYDRFCDVVFPGDSFVTHQALIDMTKNICDGQSLKKAVTAFCMEIIQSAES